MAITSSAAASQFDDVVLRHLEENAAIVRDFFRQCTGSFATFDDETINGGGRVEHLAMGITLTAPDTFTVWGRAARGTRSEKQVRRTLATMNCPVVVWDGRSVETWFTEREARYPRERAGQTSYIDAQVVYDEWQPRLFPRAPMGLGLGSAEKNLNFPRQACDFWKHAKRGEIEAFEVNILALEAYKNIDEGGECEECDLCGKPLDLVLYCVEDALSAALVFVVCSNGVPAVREEFEKEVRRAQQLQTR